jgi:hypothetical protein
MYGVNLQINFLIQWPASSYSPFFENVFGPANNPVPAFAAGLPGGFLGSAIPMDPGMGMIPPTTVTFSNSSPVTLISFHSGHRCCRFGTIGFAHASTTLSSSFFCFVYWLLPFR